MLSRARLGALAIAAVFTRVLPSLASAQEQHGADGPAPIGPARRIDEGCDVDAFNRDYWYADWATLGLAPPEPGFQWVRYGPDLLLVNVTTGQVVDVAYDVFY